jgi:hypothetical protein
VADHPLRPATDHRLGKLLPHQLANRTQAPPQALLQALDHSRHAVLAAVSRGCPPPKDRYLRITHPSATAWSCPQTVRLACVKHAASVRSEPGSNSQVHQRFALRGSHRITLTPTNRPNSTVAPSDPSDQPRPSQDQTNQKHPKTTFKAFVTHKTNTSPTPLSPAKSRSILANPNLNQTNQSPTRSHASATHRTPPTYPFLAYENVKERPQDGAAANQTGPRREALSSRRPQPCQRRDTIIPHVRRTSGTTLITR